MSHKVILFDLDNTLYHYEPCNEAALAQVHRALTKCVKISFNEFIQIHDRVRHEIAVEFQSQVTRHNRTVFFNRITTAITGTPEPLLTCQLSDIYWQTFLDAIVPDPLTKSVITKIGDKFRIGLVTNQGTEAQFRKICRLGLDELFDSIITSEDAGHEKPDSRIFNMALSSLGSGPQEATLVGDDPEADIAGASRVGIVTVHSLQYRESDERSDLADYTIHHLDELLDILL